MGLLRGYRVLELSDERGLLAGRILADLGADVVLVEPPGGSPARAAAPAGHVWTAFAANKRGIVADLDTAGGRDLVMRLAGRADFLIDSLGPGVLAGHGLGWPDLARRNPGLVYGTVTAFGHDGPKASDPASDLTVWAAGGPLQPNRDGDRPPLRPSVPHAFLNAAADLAGGMLIAHHARRDTGRGQLVDVSAQACLGLNTLARVLAEPVHDPHPEWAALATPTGRTDHSGSGSGTSSHLKKWHCADGLVEFHLAMGAAVGGFTNNFTRWMADEGACSERVASWDWRRVPELVESGEFDDEAMAEVRAATEKFLRGKTKAELLAAAVERKLLCVGINDIADLAASEQLASRDYFATIGGVRLPARWYSGDAPGPELRCPAPRVGEHTAEVTGEWLAAPARVIEPTPASADLPLAGLKVADFSWVVAGPVVGRALADFGATVVRVESATRIETARMMQPFYDGKPGKENSALYGTCNAGKYGLALDLKQDRGRAVARDLADWADVVIESFAPGQMRRWGLDYPALSARRPRLIMLSSSLMGQTGPARRLAGYGNIGASLSGYQDLVGWPDRPPIGPFGPYTDYVAPRFALAALLAAWDRVRGGGDGCYLDIAQTEIGIFLLSPQLAHYASTGVVAARMGNADLGAAPHGVYPCRSGRFVAIACMTDAHWRALAAELDLAPDPKLGTVAGRLAAAESLDAAITEWTSTRDAEEVRVRLRNAGVPAHPCADSADWAADPQLAHRGHIRTVPHPRFGTAVVEGPRYLLCETPGEVRRPAPQLGEHNEYVLRELLGYDAATVGELLRADVLT
jgi:crotonobetainyl-CoA:carnitine CoA-transferase CaiB-like acyl-CoA transferase